MRHLYARAMTRFRRATLAVALVATTAAVLAGCGESTVDKDEVAKQAQTYFDGVARDNGQEKFPEITCPDDLKAEKGETTRCSAEGDDGTLGITVTVNSVDGDTANLSFEGDDKVEK